MSGYRGLFFVSVLVSVAVLFFAAGLLWSLKAQAAPEQARKPRVVYAKKTKLDFEGLELEGTLKNPGEFYFERRTEEKFDSLVKRKGNFHRQMLRDVVMSK